MTTDLTAFKGLPIDESSKALSDLRKRGLVRLQAESAVK
jgi:hypothetical protein